MRVPISIDPLTISAKPEKGSKTIGDISTRMVSTMLTIQELGQKISAGHTFASSVFKGSRCNKNWVMQQLFAVDIDQGLSVDEALSRCDELDLHPCIVYPSYNHTDESPRFRMIFNLDQAVEDMRLRNVVQFALMQVFPECDSSCKDPARMFFPTNKPIIMAQSDAIVTLPDVVYSALSHIKKTSRTNFQRKVTQLCKVCGLAIVDGLPAMRSILETADCPSEDVKSVNGSAGVVYYRVQQDNRFVCRHSNIYQCVGWNDGLGADSEESTLTSNIIKEVRLASSESGIANIDYASDVSPDDKVMNTSTADLYELKFTIERGDVILADYSKVRPHKYKVGEDITNSPRNLQQRFDFAELKQRCKLYTQLTAGIHLDHNETWGLATSLLRVEGGETVLNKSLKKRAEITGKDDTAKWDIQINQIKSYGYKPTRCDKFCKHASTCSCKSNPLNCVSARRGNFRQVSVPSEPLLPIEQAQKDITTSIKNAFSAKDTNIHLIKAGVGLGKTTNLLCEREFVLCAPTHQLAQQIYDDAVQAGNNPILVKDLPMVDDDFNSQINDCYKIGDYNRAIRIIHVKIENALSRGQEMLTDGEERILEYAKSLEDLRNPNGRMIICTHRRLLLMKERPYNTVVFDEDALLKSQMEIVPIQPRTLSALPCMQRLYNFIISDNISSYTVYGIEAGLLPSIETARKEIKGRRAVDFENVLKVLDCTRFIKDHMGRLIFGHFLPLPKNVKIIILSATLSDVLYRQANQGRTVVMEADITNIKQIGRIIQFPEKSHSRFSIKNGDAAKSLIALMEVIGGAHVLTYKGYGEKLAAYKLNVHDNLHIDNCEGSNELQGQDIAVVGTPNQPEITYLLIADLIGMKTSPHDRLTYTRVIRNGYEFWTMTFAENPELQQLHLHILESKLIQAAGRSRTLRNDCTCWVASNVIIPGAEVLRLPKGKVDPKRDTPIAAEPVGYDAVRAA